MALRRSVRINTASILTPLASNSSNSVQTYGTSSGPPKRKDVASAPPRSHSPTNETSEETITSAILPASGISTAPLLKRRKTTAPITNSPRQDHLFDTLHTSPAKPRISKDSDPSNDDEAFPAARTNEDSLLEDAEAFLVKTDDKLRTVVELHKCALFSPDKMKEGVNPFAALSSGIIGQQVSGQAASTICSRFTALFPTTHPSFPSPAEVFAKDIPTLRTAGLSQRKAEYIHGLAGTFVAGELTAEMLVGASDDELIEKLVAVRGLGRWSVDMYMLFTLKRMDVFSTGDLGVQRGMAVYMGRDVNKLKSKGGKWKYMSEAEMLEIASRFTPYRSLFMWYMWRIADVDISAIQKKA